MLSYRSDPATLHPGPGFNLTPRHVGEQVQRSLEALLDEGRIRPLVGRTVPFEELPRALEDMEDRLTTGRTIVQL